jgi:uncharacterized protein (DUF1778 family)
MPPAPHSDSLAGPSVGTFGGTFSLNTISDILVPDWKESGGPPRGPELDRHPRPVDTYAGRNPPRTRLWACGPTSVGVQRVHTATDEPMPKNHPPSSVKESRLSIRVDGVRKAVIARAASRGGRTISDFVLENAYQMATELLADEGTIALSKRQIAHIFEVLDRPPATSVAAVRKLLRERSILDG